MTGVLRDDVRGRGNVATEVLSPQDAWGLGDEDGGLKMRSQTTHDVTVQYDSWPVCHALSRSQHDSRVRKLEMPMVGSQGGRGGETRLNCPEETQAPVSGR